MFSPRGPRGPKNIDALDLNHHHHFKNISSYWRVEIFVFAEPAQALANGAKDTPGSNARQCTAINNHNMIIWWWFYDDDHQHHHGNLQVSGSLLDHCIALCCGRGWVAGKANQGQKLLLDKAQTTEKNFPSKFFLSGSVGSLKLCLFSPPSPQRKRIFGFSQILRRDSSTFSDHLKEKREGFPQSKRKREWLWWWPRRWQ